MRITIVGGSQGTGFLLAEAAQQTGYDVTVVSRGGTGPAGVRIIRGDATDPTTAREAIAGSDAVVVTVGSAKGVRHQRAAVTRAVVEAMREEGVRRLVVQSSLGAGDSANQLPGALRLLVKAVLAKPLADHNEQEKIVQESGLQWTVVRPSGLTDKPATGQWQTLETTEPGTLKGTITRADLAACMLATLTDPATIGRSLGVSAC